MSEYIKSPMNYIGGKYKLLPQLMKEFPEDIGVFVDLFCGGLDVSINMLDKVKGGVYSNDKQEALIDMYVYMQENVSIFVEGVEELIKEYGLKDLSNKEGFLKLREDYNEGRVNKELGLFTLVTHSFNSQLRYNKADKYNTSYGYHKNYFQNIRKLNTELLLGEIGGIAFSKKDFREYDYTKLKKGDFVYIDPPYLITDASYQSFLKWGEEEERELLRICDELESRGIWFGISNVLESKGKENKILKEWCKKYNVKEIEKDYSNCNYQRYKGVEYRKTREVYITNYRKEE